MVRRQKTASAKKVKSGSRFERATFAAAFPTIKAIQVFLAGDFGSRTYNAQTIPAVIPCPNPLCRGGGFRIGDALRDMIRLGQTEREYSTICGGNEGTPAGLSSYRSCRKSVRIKIAIELSPRVPGRS